MRSSIATEGKGRTDAANWLQVLLSRLLQLSVAVRSPRGSRFGDHWSLSGSELGTKLPFARRWTILTALH